MDLSGLKLFQKVWYKRGRYAMAGTLIRSKFDVFGILIISNGFPVEYAAIPRDIVLANEDYWERGALTNWPVQPGLVEQNTDELAAYFGKPATEVIDGNLADQIWYPEDLIKK